MSERLRKPAWEYPPKDYETFADCANDLCGHSFTHHDGKDGACSSPGMRLPSFCPCTGYVASLCDHHYLHTDFRYKYDPKAETITCLPCGSVFDIVLSYQASMEASKERLGREADEKVDVLHTDRWGGSGPDMHRTPFGAGVAA